MPTKSELFKLGANARCKAVKEQAKRAIDFIISRATLGHTTANWVINGYIGDTEYCKGFLSSIKEEFPDIDVVVDNPTISYTFSWKD